MKKFLGILVLGLLWCNFSFAEVLSWKCKGGEFKYINYQLDLEKKTLRTQLVRSSNNEYSEQLARVISVGKDHVRVQDYIEGKKKWNKYSWEFNYATNNIFTVYKGEYYYDKNCISEHSPDAVSSASSGSSSSSSTDDKIAQAKQICKDLGFKTNTEKFADCSLKMLSMQFEVQNRESSSDGGTQQKIVVNQGYSVGDAMIALSGIISDANNVRSSYGTGRCRIFQHAYHANLVCN